MNSGLIKLAWAILKVWLFLLYPFVWLFKFSAHVLFNYTPVPFLHILARQARYQGVRLYALQKCKAQESYLGRNLRSDVPLCSPP